MSHFFTFYKKNLDRKRYQQSLLGFTIGGSSFNMRFYCQVPIPLKKYSLLYKYFRKLFIIPCLWILYVRSFFIIDRTEIVVLYILPLITCLFIFLNNFFPDIFNSFSAFYFHMYLGSQLILYDELGSRISHDLFYHGSPILAKEHIQYFLQHPNIIIRRISLTAISNIIIGKTAMTATGRATLIVGAFTGSAWLYNNYLEREAANQRAKADRDAGDYQAQANRNAAYHQAQAAQDAAEQLASKARAFQNYQDARRNYDNRRFYSKDTKPQWNEDTWTDWRKSK